MRLFASASIAAGLLTVVLGTARAGEVASETTPRKSITPVSAVKKTAGAAAQTIAAAPKTEVKDSTPFPLSAKLAYGATGDLADGSSPQLIKHDLSVELSAKVREWLTLGAAGGVTWESLGNGIRNDDRVFQWSAPLVAAFAKTKLHAFRTSHVLGFGIGVVLPLDEDSRFRGYRAVPGAKLILASEWASFYTLTQQLSATHVMNTYELSPVDHKPNPTSGLAYKLSNGFTLLPHLDLSVDFGVKFTNATDGFTDYAYMNREAISYTFRKVTLELSYTNGGFTDDGRVHLWYIDAYRRVVALELSYEI